jgi:predicted DNA-binding protein (UPF0251 family)
MKSSFYIENWFALCISILTNKGSEKALEEMNIKPAKNEKKILNLSYEEAYNLKFVLSKEKSWACLAESYEINGEALRQQVYKALKKVSK